MIVKVAKVIFSDLFIFFRIIFGKKIKSNLISLINPKAILDTKDGGNIELGYLCSIRGNTEVSASGGRILIGDNCFINRNCMIVAHEEIVFGNGVTVGPGSFFYDHDHDGKGGFDTAPIKIGNNVWIGAGCIILKGVCIGDNVVIGAGCIITKDVDSNTTVIQKRDTRYMYGDKKA